MIFRIETENRSVYEIDDDTKTWARLSAFGEVSEAPLRTESGTFRTRSEIETGRTFWLICDPITPGATGRYIQTSPIAAFKEVHPQ
jgi:hypothetical protein